MPNPRGFTRSQSDTKQRELVTETPPAFTVQVTRQVPPLGGEFGMRAMIFGKTKRAWLQCPGKGRIRLSTHGPVDAYRRLARRSITFASHHEQCQQQQTYTTHRQSSRSCGAGSRCAERQAG